MSVIFNWSGNSITLEALGTEMRLEIERRSVCTILRLAGINRSPDGINRSRVNCKRTLNIVKISSFISSSSRLLIRDSLFRREKWNFRSRIIVDKIRSDYVNCNWWLMIDINININYSFSQWKIIIW